MSLVRVPRCSDILSDVFGGLLYASFCLAVFASPNLFANPEPGARLFEIQTELQINGRIVSNTRVVTLANMRGTVSQVTGSHGADTPKEEFRMAVLPTDTVDPELGDAVRMKFDFHRVSGSDVADAQKEIVAKPGVETTTTFKSATGADEIQLKVTAIRRR